MAFPSTTEKVPSLITSGLIVVSVIFPLLSFTAIFLRFKARKSGRLPLKADDWWIIAAWIFVLGLSIDVWVFSGLSGINYYKISPAIGTENSLLCLIIESSLIQLPLSAVKISILFFYKRIFNVRKFRLAAWLLILLIGVWGIIFFVLDLVQGDPISATWTGKGRLRFDSTALGLAQVGTSIALDVIVLCMPLPIIFTLHMSRQRKFAIASIFWLGAFCCVAAIVRLVLVNQSVRQVIDSESSGFSAIHLQSKNIIFIIIEPNCSIIAGCLPCYGPLVAGGRAPESMIRSVRSIISLRSMRSAFSSRSKSSSIDRNQPKLQGTDGPRRDAGSTDSQIELKETYKNWPPDHGQNSHTAEVEYLRDEEAGVHDNGVINITKAVDVTKT